MAELKIDLDKLAADASGILKTRSRIITDKEEVISVMNDIRECYNSDAVDVYLKKINNLSESFDKFIGALDSYYKFMISALEIEKKVEVNLVSAAAANMGKSLSNNIKEWK